MQRIRKYTFPEKENEWYRHGQWLLRIELTDTVFIKEYIVIILVILIF